MNISARNLTSADGGLYVFGEHNYWCLWLLPLPIATVFGNTLVVLAVLTEKSLQTPTNFLIVSLATADLIVGCIVQPFSIYLVVNNLEWYLPPVMCNFFVVADVAASTASIANLVAISTDRFFAVVKHVEYRAMKHNKRILATIAFVWLFSIGLALPIGPIGFSEAADGREKSCDIRNKYYIFYGSLFAFYIPCTLMIIMYGVVFYRLRRRLRVVKMQEMAAGRMVRMSHNLKSLVARQGVGKNTLVWAMPFIKALQEDIKADEEHSVSLNDLKELTTILHTLETTETSKRERITNEETLNNPVSTATHLLETVDEEEALQLSPREPRVRIMSGPEEILSGTTSPEGSNLTSPVHQANHVDSPGHQASRLPAVLASPVDRARRGLRVIERNIVASAPGTLLVKHKRRSTIAMTTTKLKNMKERAIDLFMKLKHKEGQIVRKESRATKLVATVLGVFLICWLPFFVLNMQHVFGTWSPSLDALHILFTWFGYLNSCLNPAIYSLINRKFRVKFRNLLCFWSSSGTDLREVAICEQFRTTAAAVATAAVAGGGNITTQVLSQVATAPVEEETMLENGLQGLQMFSDDQGYDSVAAGDAFL